MTSICKYNTVFANMILSNCIYNGTFSPDSRFLDHLLWTVAGLSRSAD